MIKYRHGDVSLHLVTEDIDFGKAESTAEAVIAEGEATGHYHKLVGDVMTMKGFDEKTYIKVLKPTKLIHNEHHCLTILPGTYRQEQEVEYDYYEKAIRKVRD